MTDLVIDVRADEELLQQLHHIGHWMKERDANPVVGKMPTFEEAVLFCIETCYESIKT
jgi:hypothetical protein